MLAFIRMLLSMLISLGLLFGLVVSPSPVVAAPAAALEDDDDDDDDGSGGAATSTTYFVAPDGNDSASGLSANAAWATLDKASTTVVAGDTVHVGAGTYTGTLELLDRGRTGEALLFVADRTGGIVGDGGAVLVAPSSGYALHVARSDNVELVGFTFVGAASGDVIRWDDATDGLLDSCTITDAEDNLVNLVGAASTLTIRDSSLTDAGNHAVRARDGSIKITSTTITNASKRGVSVESGGDTEIDAVTISACKYGIYINSGNARITNAVIADHDNDGVWTGSGAGTIDIWNCTFVDISRDGIQADGGTIDTRNNIYANIGDDCVDQNSGATCTSSYCIFYNYSGSRSESFHDGTPYWVTDPLFQAGTYRPSSASPALNAGADASSLISTDRVGMARPSDGGWDIGAYEYGEIRPGPGDLSVSWFHNQTFAIDVSDVDWSGTPHHEQTAESVTWSYGASSMYPGGPADELAVRIRGVLDVPESGEWTFTLGSEDSAMFVLNGRALIDARTIHSWGDSSSTTWLPAGQHRIQLFYLERSGDQGIELGWQGPGDSSSTLIPAANFQPWRRASIDSWGEVGFDQTMISRLRRAAIDEGLVEFGSDAYNSMNTVTDALAVFGADSLDDVQAILETP